MRAAIIKLRDVGKETLRQVVKIDKQFVADRTRVYDRLGQLAEDVISELPEDVSDADYEQASKVQDQIEDLSADLEAISLTGGALEDLQTALGDALDEIFARLKEAEAQVTEVERLGVKLGV
jgi:hypothetical protein